jgi:hypothetical protein
LTLSEIPAPELEAPIYWEEEAEIPTKGSQELSSLDKAIQSVKKKKKNISNTLTRKFFSFKTERGLKYDIFFVHFLILE